MRVISGSARGRKLKRVPGQTTRPIMDRVKENLFNVVRGAVPGSRWLDMFAGTGSVGIEALSRGATEAVFLDLARPAIRTIHQNLAHTGLAAGAQVFRADALAFVRQYRGRPFDFVYIAPPQYQELWRDALREVDMAGSRLLATGAQVIVQIDPREYEPQEPLYVRLTDLRRYGKTMLLFYDRVFDGDEEE